MGSPPRFQHGQRGYVRRHYGASHQLLKSTEPTAIAATVILAWKLGHFAG